MTEYAVSKGAAAVNEGSLWLVAELPTPNRLKLPRTAIRAAAELYILAIRTNIDIRTKPRRATHKPVSIWMKFSSEEHKQAFKQLVETSMSVELHTPTSLADASRLVPFEKAFIGEERDYLVFWVSTYAARHSETMFNRTMKILDKRGDEQG